jgi:hypothetical protein
VVGGGSPSIVKKFHAPELTERDAAPVIRRSRRLQAARAFPPILVAKHSQLPFLVPSQPMRAKQTLAIVIDSGDWASALDCCTYNPVNIPLLCGAARSRNIHFLFRLLTS